MNDPTFLMLYEILPKRLAHLDHINPPSKKEIRIELFEQVMYIIHHLNCRKSHICPEYDVHANR